MAKEEYAPGTFDLGYDHLTQTRQKMVITPEGKLAFESKTNIDQVAEVNQAIRNEIVRSEKNGDMVKVASLPMTVYLDRKSTRLNSSHIPLSRMPSSA